MWCHLGGNSATEDDDYWVMRSEGYGPLPHTAGSRYCHAKRRRGGRPHAALTVRHTSNGLMLARIPRSVASVPTKRSWRGGVTAGAAVVALCLSLTLLLTGPHLVPTVVEGPCPPRTSISAYADGRELLVRTEPAQGATALLHLCADRTIGPVRAWEVRVGAAGSRPEVVAVQRVAKSVALAAAPLTARERLVVTVSVSPVAGQALVFTASVTAG